MITKNLKIGNKHLRINGKEALEYELPEHTWQLQNAKEIIKPIEDRLRDRVPLNHALIDNLRNEPIKNPILVGHDGWPWVGSQRMRSLQYLGEKEGLDVPVLVCRLTKNPLKIWKLWGGMEGQQCSSIQVQLWEVLFKSVFYGCTEDENGKAMHEYEIEGDKLYWSVRDDNPFWKERANRGKK